MRRIIVLVLIALLITFAVYGLVAALIKLDDAGAHLAGQSRTGAIRSMGRAIVTSAPALFRGIGIIGTVAMLWVGGHILAANLAKVGFHPLHHAIEWAEELSHNPGPVLDHRNSHVLPHRSRHRHRAGPGLEARAPRSGPPSQRLTINVPVCFTA